MSLYVGWQKLKCKSKSVGAKPSWLLFALQIAHFKIPHYVQFVTEFPLTVTGKVQKFKMKESAVKTLGLENIKLFS